MPSAIPIRFLLFKVVERVCSRRTHDDGRCVLSPHLYAYQELQPYLTPPHSRIPSGPQWHWDKPNSGWLQSACWPRPYDGSHHGLHPRREPRPQRVSHSWSTCVHHYARSAAPCYCSSPRLWNISSSVSRSATSLLLNSVTGEAVEHWLELDHSGDENSNDYERMLLLWPSKALEPGTSYIVAFRGIIDDNGDPVAPSDGFGALRDKRPTSNPALEESRPQYEKLFAALAAVGWARPSLSLAWSFTTNSKANVTAQFLSMRDDAFGRVAKDGFNWTVLSVRTRG